jgi:5-methylthioadenosine/S-adenosylhomocysteine deaminase
LVCFVLMTLYRIGLPIKEYFPMKKLIKNGLIVTVNQRHEIFQQGAIGYENGKIIYVGVLPQDLSTYDEIKDAHGSIIMPGLVNTHGHAAMSLLRGYADDLPLQQWLEQKMWPLEAKYTADHVKWGTNLSIIEMLRTGTTCFMDMYDYMDQVAQAVEETGIRAGLARGIIGFCSAEEKTRKVEEATEFVRNWHGQAEGRIVTMMSPHAPYTCTPELIQQITERAIAYDVPIHIHMSETKKEVEQNVKDYGDRPPEHLRKLGVFDQRVLVAHAVHLNSEEIAMLAAYDVKVSHNPISNLKLASGVAPIVQLLAKGVTVSLGTDSSASNNNLNLFEEMKMAAILHKGTTLDPLAVSAQSALEMATRAGAEAMFIGGLTGSLEVGKAADFILLHTNRAHMRPLHDAVSQLVYAASGYDVKDVFVQGKQLVANGELLTIDEERVIYQAERLFPQLL